MGLNIQRQPALPGDNDKAKELLNSFYALRDKGCTFGFWTNKVFAELDKLLAADLLIEDYDMEQLRELAGKDVRGWVSKSA